MSTFAKYDALPEQYHTALNALEIFIGDCDGMDTVIATDEHTCFDDGTIDAEDAVVAFNEIVAALITLTTPQKEPT